MLTKIFSLVAVAAGLFLLLLSIRPVYQITRCDKHWGWRFLFALVFFFVFSYLFVFTDLFLSKQVDYVHLFLSMVLFSGSVFVGLVTKLSHYSIHKTKRLADEERYNSLHDDLTGLANRKCLLESLNQFVAEQNPFALLMLDLNNFKQINDGLGHYFGDNFLAAVAQRLSDVVPDSRTNLFRIGGDEFAIILVESDSQRIVQFVEQLHHSLNSPVVVNNYPMKTSVSVGVTMFPQNSDDVFLLLKQADLAMYESKQKQLPVTLYHDELSEESYERFHLTVELSDAIRYSEFELYYQPIIRANDSVTTSYEVLIRWPVESGGFIPPDKFVPVAEKSALISALTQWVINQAATDLLRLRQRGFEGSLHINLSAKDLHTDDIVGQLDALLAAERLKAGDFMFEITEGAMFEDLEKAKRVMNEINQRGFSFSIDDFGTGFSSLLMLRELPVEQIKIDRSFVMGFFDDETNRSIVYSVLNLARDLNCSVVAEGVETRQMQQKLCELGCTYLQGYYFSKPKPLSNIHYQTNQV